ncbi:UDP-glucuronosyltransferase 2B17 [Acyrthosiphon pisum]|uniref:UDP-glucuronosyltransferase n=1 Tax=Acyrthosiphon pisum TaxID=7029 RepID=A0A8R1W0L2_ACYPI|nr:UDP-glucuronosyltransferase 2B17 [Acyrthosiphon pisum]|eukprot:XP_001947235.2 PREDICTED: UDP-glucuronosyltransferase 2B17 [Acyrthosiphon pisum]
MSTLFRTIILPVFCILTVSMTCYVSIDALQILAIESVAGKSHWNFMSAVLRSLTDAGHNVTVFTPFLDGNRENYTEVYLNVPSVVEINIEETLNTFGKPTTMIPTLMNMSRYFCNIAYEQRDMREILYGGKSNYDIIFTEVVSSECVSYIASKLELPLIYLIPSPMITHIEHTILGDVSNPATVSHLMAHNAVPRTFAQRFLNVVFLGYSLFALKYKEMEMKKIDSQPYDLVEPLKPTLVFMNTHYITYAPSSMPASLIQVGGIHLKKPKSIRNDVLEFIENSPHGVIYFTFGSVVSMSTLPDHIQNAFKEALAQVPQRVLWKYEGEMKDKPINVMTSKWFPQRDILMHPNVKLFISHGGIFGVYEAVDAGVPVLGFPLFYDQPKNIDNLVEAGMGISMDLLTLQKDELIKNILELINNEKYMQNAKIVSDRFKDRPMSPAESVVYWTEYVIRHKGAPHLKSHAFNLTWYQYFLLDVIFVILFFISFTIFINYKLFKLIYYCFLKYSQPMKPKLE